MGRFSGKGERKTERGDRDKELTSIVNENEAKKGESILPTWYFGPVSQQQMW